MLRTQPPFVPNSRDCLQLPPAQVISDGDDDECALHGYYSASPLFPSVRHTQQGHSS
jgi:hypothetical protein